MVFKGLGRIKGTTQDGAAPQVASLGSCYCPQTCRRKGVNSSGKRLQQELMSAVKGGRPV